MGKVVRVGGRGTSRRVTEKQSDNWTGDAYKAEQAKRKALETQEEREEIIRRRDTKSDKTGKKGRINYLEIHHKDRNPLNNKPTNLRVLTKKEHKELHDRSGD